MIHGELTHRIIGRAMEVHKILGAGFQEVIYQRALGIKEQTRLGVSAGNEDDYIL